MRYITATERDRQLLRNLTASGLVPRREDGEPPNYAGYLVIKPWGFECEIFTTGACSLWFLCLEPGQAVSVHCHRNKVATFLPLSENVVFKTLDMTLPLVEGITIEKGVFHSQENTSNEPGYLLEYESPSDKLDLVRYKDRYGREGTGYETRTKMVPIGQILEGTAGFEVLRNLRGDC